MKRWERRVLGLLAVGGGFVGVTIAGAALLGTGNWVGRLLVIPFLALYLWGTWCGLLLLEDDPRSIRLNAWLWAFQIPYFMSPVFGYAFSSGSLFYVTLWPMEAAFGALYRFGSQFEYSLLESDRPLIVGVNIVAIGAFGLLLHRLPEAPSDKPPTPLSGGA